MSNFNPIFTKGIKQWVSYDEHIEQLNQQIREARLKRDTLGVKLANYIEENQLTKTAFNFDNNRVIFKKEPKYSGLSYDYIFKCAKLYFNDNKKAEQLCQFIKSKREKTFIPCLKRHSKK